MKLTKIVFLGLFLSGAAFADHTSLTYSTNNGAVNPGMAVTRSCEISKDAVQMRVSGPAIRPVPTPQLPVLWNAAVKNSKDLDTLVKTAMKTPLTTNTTMPPVGGGSESYFAMIHPEIENGVVGPSYVPLLNRANGGGFVFKINKSKASKTLVAFLDSNCKNRKVSSNPNVLLEVTTTNGGSVSLEHVWTKSCAIYEDRVVKSTIGHTAGPDQITKVLWNKATVKDAKAINSLLKTAQKGKTYVNPQELMVGGPLTTYSGYIQAANAQPTTVNLKKQSGSFVIEHNTSKQAAVLWKFLDTNCK